MASEAARKGAVCAGVASSLAVGMVCPPVGIAMAFGAALLAGVLGVDRFSQDESSVEPRHGTAGQRLVPEGYEALGKLVQSGVHDLAIAKAHEIARARAVQQKGASYEVADYGTEVHWSVWTKSGRLIERGEVEIPLQD